MPTPSRPIDPSAPTSPTLSPSADSAPAVPPGAGKPPPRIGSYSILSTIGTGGMGVVYLAEQHSPRRTVALKVIRPGIASASALRRFEHEALILGRLQHPGIAQIFEAGTAETPGPGGGTQPYFAMEYIRGRPLLEHIAAHRLGTRERLALFSRICDAVQHAHAKGVIHRDLKPSNILVDESASPPQPKILDFGVARATDLDIQASTLQTDIGQLIGTLPYMSPEQVAADPDDIDTRSDIYALGVILYELLAGKPPYNLDRKMVHEAVRIIREEEPTRLSHISKVFRGDVETIVAKALDKDRTRRYQSAGDLASDITRYLRDEPIIARPASAGYQLRKFAIRHKGVVVSAAVVSVALVAGLVATATQAAIATRQRDRAQTAEAVAVARSADAVKARDAEAALRVVAQNRLEEAQQARDSAAREARKALAIADALKTMLASAAPENSRGREITIKVALATAAKDPLAGLAGEPDIQAAVLNTIGSTLRALSDLDAAELPLARALETRRGALGDTHPDTLESTLEMAILRQEQGKWPEAQPLFEQALSGFRAARGDEHPSTLTAARLYAAALDTAGKLDESAAVYHQWLPTIRGVLGPSHRDTLAAVHDFGTLNYNQGKLDEAEALFKEAYEGQFLTLKEDHPDTIQALTDLVQILLAKGEAAEAEPLSRKAVETATRVFGPDHARTFTSLSGLAQTLMTLNRLDEAEPIVRDVLARQQRVLGPGHPDTLLSMNNLAVTLHLKGDIEHVVPLLREMIATAKSAVGEEHDFYLTASGNLGHILASQQKYDEAEPLLRAVYTVQARTVGPDHPNTLDSLANLASCLMNAGKPDQAEPLARRALEGRRKTLGEDHPQTLMSMNNLAGVLRLEDKEAEAEPIIRDALARALRTLGEEDPKTALFRATLGGTLVDVKRYDEAEAPLLAAVKVLESKLGPAHAHTIKARAMLVKLYEGRGEPEKAARFKPTP